MKTQTSITLSCLAVFAYLLSPQTLAAESAAGGHAPESVAGLTIVLDFSHAKTKEVAETTWKTYEGSLEQRYTFRSGNSYQPLTGEDAPPAGYENSVRYQKTGPNEATLSYAVWEGISTYYLVFTGPGKGQVREEGFCEGLEWESTGATFVIQGSEAPAAGSSAGDSGVWDAAIARLNATTYKDAYLKSLQKRLLTILPAIRDGADINTVIPNANGTTALHNACGLGDAELVKLLLEHGADTTRKTAKGASVADCVGNDKGGAVSKLLRRYSR